MGSARQPFQSWWVLGPVSLIRPVSCGPRRSSLGGLGWCGARGATGHSPMSRRDGQGGWHTAAICMLLIQIERPRFPHCRRALTVFRLGNKLRFPPSQGPA